MAETIDRDEIPQATVVPPRRRRISVVWVIPIVAAVVGIGIAVQRIISEGPKITILFKSAGGVEAGKTFIKYKDVNIGQVSEVHLASDYSKVEVTAKIDKSAAGLIVEDAKFWVVEPRVTLSGVSGLGTLLSGNYIGFEPGKSKKQQRSFTGIEAPPIITSGESGRQFLLTSDNLGSVGIGSPVYYRRLQVGQVIAYKMADDGNSVSIKVFVNAPYDKFVKAGTRFWNASGIDASVGAGGVEIRTQSIVAVLAGGLAFDTPPFAPKAQPAAAADAVFVLYNDQATAMKQPDALAVRYVLFFNESLRGLSVGAPVTLLGLQVGSVTEVGIDVNPKTMNIRGRVEVVAYPERLAARLDETQASLGKMFKGDEKQRHAFLRTLVEQHGLRAQLRSGSLVTGQLFVAFDYYPNASKAKIDWSRDPAELPVIASTLTDIEEKVTNIVARLDKVPLEAIGADIAKALVTLDEMLQGANKAVTRIDAEVTPGLKTTLDGIKTTLVSADGVLKNADSTLVGKDAPAQQDLRDALQEITRAARSLRVLSDYLESHPESLVRGKTEEKP